MANRFVLPIVLLMAGATISHGQEQQSNLRRRVKALEMQVESLEQQLALLKAELAAIRYKPQVEVEASKDEAKRKGPGNADMGQIYKSMKLNGARVVGGPFSIGDTVTVAYELKNTCDEDLEIPLNSTYSRPFNLVGARQHWIERNAIETTIPAIPPHIAREGSKYASGGSIIYTKPKLAAGESLSFTQRVATRGYPAGKYNFYIDYKQVQGGVLQTEKVEFELTE